MELLTGARTRNTDPAGSSGNSPDITSQNVLGASLGSQTCSVFPPPNPKTPQNCPGNSLPESCGASGQELSQENEECSGMKLGIPNCPHLCLPFLEDFSRVDSANLPGVPESKSYITTHGNVSSQDAAGSASPLVASPFLLSSLAVIWGDTPSHSPFSGKTAQNLFSCAQLGQTHMGQHQLWRKVTANQDHKETRDKFGSALCMSWPDLRKRGTKVGDSALLR